MQPTKLSQLPEQSQKIISKLIQIGAERKAKQVKGA